MRKVAGRGKQCLIVAEYEAGEAGRGPHENARPAGYGVGGAAVGVAGSVVQGELGRGVVVVAEVGGGELLEGGASEKRGCQGCGQAGVSGRVGQAAGNFPGSVRGERCGL
ncbi:hypothetical protein [Streptomyces sp. DASNCL29]|uniref:hypothetical protein n=1 Tax=Streptomyces sp. DASNCL29 TaxID=2583819 RepID=UPI001485D07A|nr:hypothetical protein [Streptomyces sp. DASNCL29]